MDYMQAERNLNIFEENECAFVITVFSQLCEDLIIELQNTKGFNDGRFTWEFSNIKETINGQRKRIRRAMTDRKMADNFEDIICDIVDSCDKHLLYAKQTLKSELLMYIKYDMIMPIILLSLCGGLMDCVSISMRKISASNAYAEEVRRNLNKISIKIGNCSLNGVECECKNSAYAVKNLINKLLEEIDKRLR